VPTFNTTPKRKADDGLRRPNNKTQRTGSTIANSSRPITQVNRPPALDSSVAKMKITPIVRSPALQQPCTTTSNGGQPTSPPSTDATKPPPKKGSYAEIMARGKAAQATLGQVGRIQHKRIEKGPSKRERGEMKARKHRHHKSHVSNGVNGNAQIGGQPPHGDGRNGIRENNGKVSMRFSSEKALPEKKIKKAALATTGYAGTARPKPGATKSTSKSSASASASRHGSSANRYQASVPSRRHDYVSEEDDEEEEDEEGDQEYDSDVSSDMEAAAFEVDEEEEEAARIARREDAEALREENRLKHEKEEKRRKLAAMAKSRR